MKRFCQTGKDEEQSGEPAKCEDDQCCFGPQSKNWRFRGRRLDLRGRPRDLNIVGQRPEVLGLSGELCMVENMNSSRQIGVVSYRFRTPTGSQGSRSIIDCTTWRAYHSLYEQPRAIMTLSSLFDSLDHLDASGEDEEVIFEAGALTAAVDNQHQYE